MNFDDLEKDLKAAMTREPAPPDFSARLMARLEKDRTPARSIWNWTALPIAASVAAVVLIPMAEWQESKQQDEKALSARRELSMAIAITQDQLAKVRSRIQRTH